MSVSLIRSISPAVQAQNAQALSRAKDSDSDDKVASATPKANDGDADDAVSSAKMRVSGPAQAAITTLQKGGED
jgi:hypothetical protein